MVLKKQHIELCTQKHSMSLLLGEKQLPQMNPIKDTHLKKH